MKRNDLAKLVEFITALLTFLLAIMVMTVENISLGFQGRMIVGGYFIFVSLLCVWFLILRRIGKMKDEAEDAQIYKENKMFDNH